eukprot:342655-Prymnesium_polylepis.1
MACDPDEGHAQHVEQRAVFHPQGEVRPDGRAHQGREQQPRDPAPRDVVAVGDRESDVADERGR